MAIAISTKRDFTIDDDTIVSLKTMGKIYEITYTQKRNIYCYIRKVDDDHYYIINPTTGEYSDLYECNHIKNRSESLFQFGQSQKRLRDYINTNVVDPNFWKWITLTYRENMTDTKKLYDDIRKFILKVRYKFKDYKIEYIISCEPQARGAWHVHLLLGFDKTAPFIADKIINQLWGHGFTKTKSLANIDNIGAYLSAYLGDLEYNKENIHELQQIGLKTSKNGILDNIKYVTDENGVTKKYIKGARLYLYPPKFNMYRCSKGIKKPLVEQMDYFDAKLKVGITLSPTFKTCKIIDDFDNNFHNCYCYEHYNTARNIIQK